MRTLVFIIISITSACVTDSPIKQFCDRADECNYLSGSVSECTQDLEAQREHLAPSDQGELDLAVQDCLDHPSCGGFKACVDAWGH